MSKNFFNAHALDDLINESLQDADQLTSELSEINAKRNNTN